MYIHKLIFAYTNIHVFIYIYMYIYICIHTYVYIYIHIYMYTYIYIYTCIHTHTHTHTHTHNTHLWQSFPNPWTTQERAQRHHATWAHQRLDIWGLFAVCPSRGPTPLWTRRLFRIPNTAMHIFYEVRTWYIIVCKVFPHFDRLVVPHIYEPVDCSGYQILLYICIHEICMRGKYMIHNGN